jgi:hypothetical protein
MHAELSCLLVSVGSRIDRLLTYLNFAQSTKKRGAARTQLIVVLFVFFFTAAHTRTHSTTHTHSQGQTIDDEWDDNKHSPPPLPGRVSPGPAVDAVPPPRPLLSVL